MKTEGRKTYKTPYETCWNCGGSGLELSFYNGEPTTCHVCHGDTAIRARDEHGRFTTREIELEDIHGSR